MCVGGGPADQLLMLSLNLLKSKLSYTVEGGGGGGLPTNFEAKSKSVEIPNSLYIGGGGGVCQPTFEAESKSAEIPNSLYGWGGGLPTNFNAESSPSPKSAEI